MVGSVLKVHTIKIYDNEVVIIFVNILYLSNEQHNLSE